MNMINKEQVDDKYQSTPGFYCFKVGNNLTK